MAAELAGLTGGARVALVAACASVSPLSPRALPHLGATEADVRHLVARGLLVVRSDAAGAPTVVPVHDLVREAVADAAPADADLHAALCAWFRSRGEGALAAAAHHTLRGGDAEAGARLLGAAGRVALARGAFDWAARLLAEAVEVGADPVAVAEPRGKALASAGRHDAAIGVWLDAADRARGLQRVRLLGAASDLLFGGGHFDRGMAVLGTLLEEGRAKRSEGLWSYVAFVANTLHAESRIRRPGAASASEADHVQLEALWTAANSLTPFDPVAGQAIHARFRALAFAHGSPVHRANALGSQLLFRRGQAWSTEREERLLRDLLLWVPDEVRGYVVGCRGYGLRLGCDFAGSNAVLAEALACFGDQEERFWYSRFGKVAMLLNDTWHVLLAELRQRAEHVLRDAEARRDRAARVGLDLSVSWMVTTLASDDVEAGRACLDAIPDHWGRELQPEQQLRMTFAGFQLALYAGDLDAARSLLGRPNAAVRRHWRFKLIPLTWHLARGRLALLAGSGDVQREVDALRALGEPATLGAADLLEVGRARLEGRDDAALRDRARQRLDAQRHGLYAAALAPPEEARALLAAHGCADPERARRWLVGV